MFRLLLHIYIYIYIQSPQSPTYRKNSVHWGVSLSSAWLRAHTDGLQRPPAGLSHACSSLLNSLEQKNHGFLIMLLFCLFRMTLLLYSFFFSLSLSCDSISLKKSDTPFICLSSFGLRPPTYTNIFWGSPQRHLLFGVWRGADLQEDAWRQS